MTIHAKGPPCGGSPDGPLDVSLLADNQRLHQNQAPNQAQLERNPRALREAKLVIYTKHAARVGNELRDLRKGPPP
jgi:hypothetical protein